MPAGISRPFRLAGFFRLQLLVVSLLGIAHTPRLQAFSLLGPYADWMDVTNAFRQPGDIGGPMEIDEAYRWNVPLVTYGFDQSFLDYFGSNGVVAVEAAISVINNLPPASAVVLTNFPTYSERVNYSAQSQGLWDLKSATLAALVEHLGLAQPTRYIYSIRKWSTNLEAFAYLNSDLPAASDVISNYLVQLNFDPQTLMPSPYVNGTLYSGFVFYNALNSNGVPSYADVLEFAVDPLALQQDAVADASGAQFGAPSQLAPVSERGTFYTGLTYDDVGGLAFLLSTNHLKVEGALPGVQSAATNGGFVKIALRPGVDKITFTAHPRTTSGTFALLTNSFTDTYVTNGQTMHQQLERVIAQPDFLFTADDNSKNSLQTQLIVRSDTSNWMNNSALNGDTNLFGPGLIVPPVKITFHEAGAYVVTGEPTPEVGSQYTPNQWGFFDQTTNAPIAFPSFAPDTARPLSVRLRLVYKDLLLRHTWQLSVPIGATASLQTSTNLSDWMPVMTVTNNGTVIEWFHEGPFPSKRFFRVSP
jgi:hypothetical protein